MILMLGRRPADCCTMSAAGAGGWLTSPPGAASDAAVQARRRLLDHVENDTAMAFSVGTEQQLAGSECFSGAAVVLECDFVPWLSGTVFTDSD